MVEVKFKTKSSLQVMFTSMVEMKIKTKSRIQIMFTSSRPNQAYRLCSLVWSR